MPKATKAPVKIIADHREKAIVPLLRLDPGVELEVAQLELGDFLIAPDFALERKAAADVAASVIDKRLFDQTDRAAAAGMRFALIVEGDAYRVGRLHPNAIAGAFSYIGLTRGHPIIHTPSPQVTAYLIRRAGEVLRDGLGYEISMRSTPPRDPSLQQLYILEGLPEVGPVNARKLLAAAGTIRRVFAMTETEMAAVVGQAAAATVSGMLDRSAF